MLILERPWTRQPQTEQAVNKSSEQAEYLTYWLPMVGGSLRDVSGWHGFSTNFGSTIRPIDNVIASYFDGASYLNTTPTLVQASSAALTISAVVNLQSFANEYNCILQQVGATGGNMQILVKSTGKIAVYVNVGLASSYVSYDGTGATTLEANKTYCISASYDSINGLVCLVNGKIDGTATANGSMRPPAGTPFVFVGKDNNFAGRFITGSCYDVRVYSAASSVEKMQQIHKNPWQLFQPRRIYIPTAAAAGAPSITALSAISITATSAQPRISYS